MNFIRMLKVSKMIAHFRTATQLSSEIYEVVGETDSNHWFTAAS